MSSISSPPNETSASLRPSESSLVGLTYQTVADARNKSLFSSKPKAFRLRSIPNSVTVDALRQWLDALHASSGLEDAPHVLQLSLAPIDVEYAHAIVTFSGTPSVFSHIEKEFIFPGPNGCEIEVDDHFLGVTVLYAPPIPSTAVADIIAIHGFGGHAMGSWKSLNNYHVWLRDFLPHETDAKNARILTYGYNTSVRNEDEDPGKVTLESLSKEMLELISSVRNDGSNCRPIIILGHSLGGLIIKNALIIASRCLSYTPYHDFYYSCRSLVFFGVPNRGIRHKQLEFMVKDKLSLQLAKDVCVGEDRNPKPFLDSLSDAFLVGIKDLAEGGTLDILCYYELQPMPDPQAIEDEARKGIIPVDQISATFTGLGTNFYNEQPLGGDHRSMVKFSSRNDTRYVAVRSRIQGFLRRAVQNHKNLTREERQRLLLMMRKGPNVDYIIQTMIPTPCAGTLDWFFNRKEYVEWKSSPLSSSIWIQGSPGQGKSVLAKRIVSELKIAVQSQSSEGIIYFFCYQRHEQFRSADAILRGFIVQLLGDQPSIPEELEMYLNDLDTFTSETSARLFDLFKILLENSHRSTYYFVIDALDECEPGNDRAELLSRLQNLCTENIVSKSIKFFFTGRPGPQADDLEESLHESTHVYLQADMDDIAKVIDHDIKGVQSGRNKNFILRESDAIINTLSRKSGRTYIWIRSMIKELRAMSPPTLAAFQALVDNLPTDLDKLYRKLVEQFFKDDFNTRLLLLVSYAKRPLEIEELFEAIAVGSCSDYCKLDDMKPHMPYLDEGEIRERAGTLLEVTEGRYVSLIHQSVKDFLIKENPFQTLDPYHDPEYYVAQICCIYLCSQDFEIPIPPILKETYHGGSAYIGYAFNEYKLLHYASHYWYQHIKDYMMGLELEKYIIKLVSPQLVTTFWWQLAHHRRIRWPKCLPFHDGKDVSKIFHIAIRFEMEWLAQLLLSGQCENLSEPFPEDDIIYVAKTRLSFFLVLMRLHQIYQLAFDEHSTPLAIATAGDPALYHMKCYYDSGHRQSPCPENLLTSLSQSASCIHKTFEFLIDRGLVTFLPEDIIRVALSNDFMMPETMDMLLSRSRKLTAGLIYAAAKNKWELAWHLIKRDEVKISVEVLMANLDAKLADPYRLQGLLNHICHFRSINISRKIVQIVDVQALEVRLPFMDALLRQTDQISIEPGAARLISRFFPIAFTRILVERHEITISGLVAVFEGNEFVKDKTPILDLIFEHLEKFPLTEDVIRDAVKSSMLHSVVNRYGRECQGLCRIFLPQTGVKQIEAALEQIRVAKISRRYDGAVAEYIIGRSDNPPITDSIMMAAVGLPDAAVAMALHNYEAKHQICSLPVSPELLMTVIKNPGPGAPDILNHLISLDDGASMTNELLNTAMEAAFRMHTTKQPRWEMIVTLLQLKTLRGRDGGTPESLYKAAIENHETFSTRNVVEGLLKCSHRTWQPSYSLLETAARNNLYVFLQLQDYKRTKIDKEDIPEHQALMKLSMSPEILLAAIGNAGVRSKTPELVRYILEQPGQLEITPDVWRTARMNPTYGKKLDYILKEFISKKSREPAQDSNRAQDINRLDNSEELFLLQDSADSDAASWDGDSELADDEEVDFENEEEPTEELA